MTAPQQNTTDIRCGQAVRAWTRRNSGDWTEADEAQLQKWLDASPENRAAYEKMARVWAALGHVEGRISRAATPDRQRTWRTLRWATAAALIILTAPAWLMFDGWWNGKAVTWSARRGEPRSISLGDGTLIVLDADSQITTRIGTRSRHATLLRGEALLSVVHDAGRPFEVTVGRGHITDVGTRFDIENLEGRARISVLEGRVGVETPRGKQLLEAGTAGGYDDQGVLQPVEAIDRSVASWLDGQRHFNAERLADVLERMQRYHDVSFAFTDPRLQSLRVSGTFRTADLSLFLRTLQSALPIEVRWMDPQHVEVSPRAGVRPRG